MRVEATLTLLVLCSAADGGAEVRGAAGIILLDRRESGLEASGKVQDVEVDSAGLSIATPLPLGTMKERAAPEIPKRPLTKVGKIHREALAADLHRNFKDLELCRYKVAAAAQVPVADIKAGEVSLHWTILRNGTTRDTLVFEGTETEFALMKCVRRRMNSWVFAKPRGGPVSVAFDYKFADKDGTGPASRP